MLCVADCPLRPARSAASVWTGLSGDRDRSTEIESTAVAAATTGGTWDKAVISGSAAERPLSSIADVATCARATSSNDEGRAALGQDGLVVKNAEIRRPLLIPTEQQQFSCLYRPNTSGDVTA